MMEGGDLRNYCCQNFGIKIQRIASGKGRSVLSVQIQVVRFYLKIMMIIIETQNPQSAVFFCTIWSTEM